MEQEVEESTITERTVLFERTALVNTTGKPPHEERLIAALQRNPSGSKVVSLHVSQTSLVKTLAAAVALRNLQHVRIASRHVCDYQALRALHSLKELTVEVQRRSVLLPDLTQSKIAELGIGPTIKNEPAMIGRMKSLRSVVLMHAWPGVFSIASQLPGVCPNRFSSTSLGLQLQSRSIPKGLGLKRRYGPNFQDSCQHHARRDTHCP